MKNWISKLTLALLLTLTFALPAFAWQDHGNTYTAIDGLDSQRLTTQGEVSLPTLSEQFSMGLHVDIVDDLENYSISDYAALFYDQYGYGVGDDQDGAVLMIYVVDQGGTIDFMDYCIYTRGKGSDAMNSDNAANLYAALDLILQGTGRSYEDAGEACANAVDVFSSNIALLMTEQSDPSLLTGDNAETLEPQGEAEHEMEPQGVPEGNEPNTEPDATYAPEPEEPAEAPQTAVPTEGVQESESEYAMIFDEAGLLTDPQRLRLENQAQKIASKYDCNPYVLTVDSLDGAAPREFAKTYYQEHALGNGDYRNGICFWWRWRAGIMLPSPMAEIQTIPVSMVREFWRLRTTAFPKWRMMWCQACRKASTLQRSKPTLTIARRISTATVKERPLTGGHGCPVRHCFLSCKS